MDSSKTPELLSEALKFGIRLGLERMERLMEILGNPEESLKVIHVAGTNGKGSVCTYISTILANADLKVGIFTSPYLERFSERMRILNGRSDLLSYTKDDSVGEISGEELNVVLEKVRKAKEQMVSEGMEEPTEFELVTAMCFLWFKEKAVDVAVMEVGLGGRLDSTNVIKNPLISVVTAIGFDHTDRLGNTITAITGEKAGIFKPGCKAIVFDPYNMILTPEQQEECEAAFIDAANKAGCDMVFNKVESKTMEYLPDGKMQFSVPSMGIEDYVTTLMGEHQVYNCALAVGAVKALCDVYEVSDECIREGVELSRWKCRVESISTEPVVLLDGGHNPQGIKSLSDALTKIYAGKLVGQEMRLMIGVMADKDVAMMIDTLENSGIKFTSIYATTVNNPRSMSGSELGNKINVVYNKSVEVVSFDDAKTCAREALHRTFADSKPLLVTGSLYLLGEVRGELKRLIEER